MPATNPFCCLQKRPKMTEKICVRCLLLFLLLMRATGKHHCTKHSPMPFCCRFGELNVHKFPQARHEGAGFVGRQANSYRWKVFGGGKPLIGVTCLARLLKLETKISLSCCGQACSPRQPHCRGEPSVRCTLETLSVEVSVPARDDAVFTHRAETDLINQHSPAHTFVPVLTTVNVCGRRSAFTNLNANALQPTINRGRNSASTPKRT